MNIKYILSSSLSITVLLFSMESCAWAGSDKVSPASDHAVEQNSPEPQSAPEGQSIERNITGRYLAGQFSRMHGNMDEATHSLAEVHQERPDDSNVTKQLQGMYLLQGRIDEALPLASAINQSENKDPLSLLLQSLQAIKNNHTDDAATMFKAASDNGNNQLWLPLIQGWVSVSRHTLAKPMTLEDVNIDIGHAAPLVNYHLALINSQAGFKDEAAKDFAAAIEDPQDPPARIMAMLLKFYEHNDAPELLAPLVKKYHDSHPDRQNAGVTPVVSTPVDGIAEVLYTMGGIMFGAGAVNDAVIYLQLAVYIKPDFEDATVALGDAFGELQQYAASNQNYSRISLRSPLYIKSQEHIAVNYDRMGRQKDAFNLLDQLSEQTPEEYDMLVTKGDLLRIHTRYNEAIQAYTLAIKRIAELKMDNWPIFFARAACFERLGKWPEAEKDLRQALILKPDQPDVLNYLGFSELERGVNIAEAREMITKAVKVRPNDAQIVDSMGWVMYLQGDYQLASQYMEKALELMPGDPSINDHLGDVYWRLGRRNEARFQWERSLTFTPEAKQAAAIYKKLKEGLPPAILPGHSFSANTYHAPIVAAAPDLNSH